MAVLGVDDHGARRDGDRKILAGRAVAIGAAAVNARLGLPRFAMGEHGEAVDSFASDKDHAAAVAAVAAVGSAQRDVLFPPEADATVAALAGLETNHHFIDKHRSLVLDLSRHNRVGWVKHGTTVGALCEPVYSNETRFRSLTQCVTHHFLSGSLHAPYN